MDRLSDLERCEVARERDRDAMSDEDYAALLALCATDGVS